jgi:AcrR family transcriptional regulator
MQYLKDEVRNSIVEEALKEFKQFGYKGASIRSIAKNSNTSVGNIYKYFQSKEDLYEKLIGSVYNRLMEYADQLGKVELNDKAEYMFYELIEEIMEIFKENSTELAILFNKSEGSKYESCKATFINFITRIVTETVEYKLLLQNKKLKNNYVIYLISYSLVESIALILKEKEEGTIVRKLILDLIDIFYKDIENKLDSE